MIDVRERLTEHLNRARLKLEMKRAVVPLLIVAVGGVVGLVAWGVQVRGIAAHALTASDQLSFEIDDATAIVPGRNDVRFKGIPAGKLMEVETVDGQPVVTVQLLREFTPVYNDARVEVRPNTALEDMYLDIVDRGTPAAGEATADTPLPASQAASSEQVEEVLQVFDPEARGHLAAVLRDLGGGLEDRGAKLRSAFGKAVPFVQLAARLSDQLAARSRKTRRLVTNFATLTGELGRRDRELRVLLSEGGTTLRTLADSSTALDAMLGELPPTLGELEGSLASLRGILPDVDRALQDLRPVAAALPEGLDSIERLSDSARPAVGSLRAPVRALVPFARELDPFASQLRGTITRLRGETPTFDHVTTSAVPCIYPGVYGFMHNTASLTKFQDARMEFPRGDAVISVGSNPTMRDPNTTPAPGCAPGMPKVGGF